MLREMETDNNIGSAIQYFRESYGISQSRLCKGICSTATLSRIESGERDVDVIILETLLERLGKIPYQFELILTDFDYEIYQIRQDINRLIETNNIDGAYELIRKYEELASDKGSPHKQFIMICHARLNELQEGNPEKTIEMLMEAITFTVPDFRSDDEMRHYFLSASEFNILIDILQKMISTGMTDEANKIWDRIINYLNRYHQMERSNSIYPKVAAIGAKFLMDQGNLERALDICNTGLDKNKGSRKMNYLAELNLYKAQIIERQTKRAESWEFFDKEECVSLYLRAYHIFSFFEDDTMAGQIKNHLREEYRWEDID